MAKPLVRELVWLLVAVVITLILSATVFGWDVSSGTTDFYLFDTYFIVSVEIFLLLLFPLITYLLFAVKETRHRFGRSFPGLVIIVSGILLVAAVTVASRSLSFTGGFTLYPPLSAMNVSLTDERIVDAVDGLEVFVLAVQVIVITTIVYVAFRLGRSKKITTGEPV